MIDQLIRSKRKTLSIEISHDATITVRAPLRLAQWQIQEFIDDKQQWIIKKQEQAKQKLNHSLVMDSYQQGALFWFQGKRYPLTIQDDNTAERLAFDSEQFILASNYQQHAYQYFRQWYWQQTKDYIQQYLPYYAEQHQLTYKHFKITHANSRWGSCTHQSVLNFSWRLSMAPKQVIDYIIHHELAHTKHFNHSNNYWNLVAQIYPAYKQAEQWLREYGHHLQLKLQ